MRMKRNGPSNLHLDTPSFPVWPERVREFWMAARTRLDNHLASLRHDGLQVDRKMPAAFPVFTNCGDQDFAILCNCRKCLPSGGADRSQANDQNKNREENAWPNWQSLFCRLIS